MSFEKRVLSAKSWAQKKIDRCASAKHTFDQDYSLNPFIALRGAKRMIETSAGYAVATQLLSSISTCEQSEGGLTEDAFNALLKSVSKEVNEKAMYTETSTDQISNIADRARLSALAEFIDYMESH